MSASSHYPTNLTPIIPTPQTPCKKATPEDRRKTSEDIHVIFDYFRGYLKELRPGLDVG